MATQRNVEKECIDRPRKSYEVRNLPNVDCRMVPGMVSTLAKWITGGPNLVYHETFSGNPNPVVDTYNLGPLQIGDTDNFTRINARPPRGGLTLNNKGDLLLEIEGPVPGAAGNKSTISVGAFVVNFPSRMDYVMIQATFQKPVGTHSQTATWACGVVARTGPAVNDTPRTKQIATTFQVTTETGAESVWKPVANHNCPGLNKSRPVTGAPRIPATVYNDVFPPNGTTPDPYFTLQLFVDRQGKICSGTFFGPEIAPSFANDYVSVRDFYHDHLSNDGPLDTLGVGLAMADGIAGESAQVQITDFSIAALTIPAFRRIIMGLLTFMRRHLVVSAFQGICPRPGPTSPSD